MSHEQILNETAVLNRSNSSKRTVREKKTEIEKSYRGGGRVNLSSLKKMSVDKGRIYKKLQDKCMLNLHVTLMK